MNILTLGVVKTTSSLTYKVVGQVKNAFTVYFSILIFGNPVTSLQVLGYGGSIAGFLWYAIECTHHGCYRSICTHAVPLRD